MTISSELARLLDAMHSTTPSEPALQRAELLLADQIAVSLKGTALAAGRTPPRRGHRPSATRWGDGARGFGPDIAFDNRRVADPLELTAGPECGAALVAAAEIADRSLKDLLASLCWAAELDRLLRGVFQKAVEQNGLHPPGLFAPAATAAAATWLLGHDLEATRHALHSSLCLLPMSPYVAFSSGSTAKELYGAWGQQIGLSLALMAGKGLTGPRNPFGELEGLGAALDVIPRVPQALSTASTWAIEEVRFKYYPCSRACHAALTALEGLPPATADEVDSLRVTTYPFAATLSSRARGDSPIGAQMHIPTTLALRVVFGELPEVIGYAPERIGDPRVIELAGRIQVTAERHPGPRRRFARIVRSLTDGRQDEFESIAAWSDDDHSTIRAVTARARRFGAEASRRAVVEAVLGRKDLPVRGLFAPEEKRR